VVDQEYAFTPGHDQVGVDAKLRLLVNYRWKLGPGQSRAGNQLTQILDVLFRQLAEVLTNSLTSLAAPALLARYPTPAALVAADPNEVYRTVVFEASAPRKAAHVPQLLKLAARSVDIADLVSAEAYLVGQPAELGPSQPGGTMSDADRPPPRTATLPLHAAAR
jgi:hypothetical protein